MNGLNEYELGNSIIETCIGEIGARCYDPPRELLMEDDPRTDQFRREIPKAWTRFNDLPAEPYYPLDASA